MWTIKISKQADDFCKSLGSKHQKQVENAFNLIAQDPKQGKPLVGELRGYWSFRVGMFRIIYVIRESTIIVEILRIHHRKEVYEKLRRWL